jgi:hypothetical protein
MRFRVQREGGAFRVYLRIGRCTGEATSRSLPWALHWATKGVWKHR